MRPDPRVPAVLALLVAISLRVFALGAASRQPGIDYYQFWLVDRAEAESGLSNPYSSEGRAQLLAKGRELQARAPGAERLQAAAQYRSRVETFSTPFLYAALSALGSADYEASLDRFRLLSIACFAAGVALLCSLAGETWTLAGLWLLTLSWMSDPLASDLRVANVNALQLGAIAAYLWLARDRASLTRELSAGALLGALIAFKPTLGIALLFLAIGWVARRDWRTFWRQGSGLVAAGALAVAGSCVFFRSARVWLDWVGSLPDLERAADVSVYAGNYSLARIATERGGPDLSIALVTAAILAMAVGAWLGARRAPAAASHQRDDLAFGLGCAASVVALRLAWLHYYLLLTPLAIYLLRARSTPRWLAAVGAGIVLALGAPARVLAPALGSEATASCYGVGAVLLLSAGLFELARPRR